MIVYHGSSKLLSKAHGYISKYKKGRFEFGCGLYTSIEYNHARRYGRCVSEMDLVLDSNKDSRNISIDFREALNRLGYIVSKPTIKRLTESFRRFDDRDTITLHHLITLLVNFDPLFHKHSQEINNFLLSYNCTHSTERSYSDMVIIHDFNVIKTIKRAFT